MAAAKWSCCSRAESPPIAARRVAGERSAKLGGEVGYQVRFENHTSLDTKIEFITEGVLLRPGAG
ncbi:MAG: hypothetical protein Ct9H300mP32_5470 [Verrucomicrobiota bacterium]|nr:MAG: hypothetical protein Ct9H300mP32_5470 [Verrucomicrobiota bacterium]